MKKNKTDKVFIDGAFNMSYGEKLYGSGRKIKSMKKLKYCECDGDYCWVEVQNNECWLCSKPIKPWKIKKFKQQNQ